MAAHPATESDATGLPDEPWFASGLRFKCTECGNCCTGSAGSVYLSQADIARLAAHFDVPPGRFVRRYTRVEKGHRVLADRPESDECVFLRDKTCTVYDARPTQCRTYPWWLVNIQDPRAWQETAAVCEGIDHPTAPLVSLGEIVEQVLLDQANESNLDQPNGRSR
ncbi:MAG TPA: YkgJ family cysteine cluster protein [Dehalococcoidia bacterium]|nr:YkgJ family cysteine cluster protein [Dehalococcoidia bacterium]